jgi:hypothetical protein
MVSCRNGSTSCGYDVSGIILLQSIPVLRGITLEVLPLSNYALNPLLETVLELLLWNNFQWRYAFLDVFNIVKSSSL